MKKLTALVGLIIVTFTLAISPASADFLISGSSTSAQTLSAGQTGTITSTGTLNVNGSAVAVTVTGNATIVNNGLLEQTGSARAIRDNTGSLTLSVTNTGTIMTFGADTFQMNKPGSSVSLFNSGTIASMGTTGSTNGQAVDWAAINTSGGSTTLTNTSGGIITAADSDAIEASKGMVIVNDGIIKGGGSGNDAINAGTNGNLVITNASANLSTNGNLIEGAKHGITGGDLTGAAYLMSITNNSNGTIKGDNGSGINIDGVNGNEVVTINNAGTISGTGVTGDGDGVDVDGVVNLTNTGTISSFNYFSDTSEGVTVGGGTIVNSGTIMGSVSGTNTSVGRGITLAGVDKDASGNPINIQKIYTNTTVLNSGLIKGDTGSGIGILGFNTTVTATYTAINYSVTITNTLGGIIQGGGSVAAIDGGSDITVSGTGTATSNDETVINYGTIQATGSGKAISLGMGNNNVQILGSAASVIGDMSGGTLTGTNTAVLTIDPTTGHSFSYGGSISNFTNVKIQSGTVTLSGTNTYTGPTNVNGGKLAVNGSVTSNVIVATGAEVGGSGKIAGTISGAGSVGPGNSPGILTATSVDPSGGLSFNFELTQNGAPTWGSSAASGNDVLHLTAALPFTAAMTSSNTVNLYFSSLGLTYQGGFFTEGGFDNLTSNIVNATYNYYLLDNANGTVVYNGNKYDLVTGTETVVQVTGANFGAGPINGWTGQYTVSAVPEPSTYVLIGLGAAALFVMGRRRSNKA